MDLIKMSKALEPLARKAGEKIMEVYAKDPKAKFKGDGSPVTEADQAAEAIILPALMDVAPGIAIVSEENAASHQFKATEKFFLVDPLDGTKEFLKRDNKGSFTVNIALIDRGAPVMGVVFAPALDRLFIGVVGKGATEKSGNKTVSLSVRNPTPDGVVAVASASHRDEATDNWLAEYNIKNTISVGSSLKFCLIAAGEADVYPRFGPTMEWDTGAGDAVLRAAGGKTTLPNSKEFIYGKPEYRNGAFVAWGGFAPSMA